jgi:hypothetical protein
VRNWCTHMSNKQKKKESKSKLGVVAHIYLWSQHLGGWGRRIMNLRPAWDTQKVSGQTVQLSEMLSQKIRKGKQLKILGKSYISQPWSKLNCSTFSDSLMECNKQYWWNHKTESSTDREFRKKKLIVFINVQFLCIYLNLHCNCQLWAEVFSFYIILLRSWHSICLANPSYQ